uniref:ZT_dimer domain-containing protein n=1 Tax=Angiostrongylus cantonensis TaxID=6313 RepID=A0A0K0D6Q9_ANGCA
GLIAVSWFRYSLEHVPILVGVRAERNRLIRVLKIAVEHDNRIRKTNLISLSITLMICTRSLAHLSVDLHHCPIFSSIHHAMVYHTGVQATVELHIVMDESLSLKTAMKYTVVLILPEETLQITHDISHSLQEKLLKLDFVERAFVHCDYDCDE